MPGEYSHEVGRAYVYIFTGCLERAVKPFRALFNVYIQPDKLEFTSFSGASYSFDVSGTYEMSEVFIESKGRQDSAGLLDDYRAFLAKAYCTSVQFKRHQHDLFWFLTNVPFASSIGRDLWTPRFIQESLRTPAAAMFMGSAKVDSGHTYSLSNRIAVGIFTDSFIKVMGTTYRFRPGDTLWSVTKLIHGGRIPLSSFEPIANSVRSMNDLPDVNRIRSGQRLQLPWYGIPGAL